MSYQDNQSKIVVVLNKQIELGNIINAANHAIAGLISMAEIGENLEFLEYQTTVGWQSKIAKNPIIILKGDNSNQLQKFHHQIMENHLLANPFVHTMIGESAAAQISATRNCKAEDLVYWAIAVFGKRETLHPLTKRFSLFK